MEETSLVPKQLSLNLLDLEKYAYNQWHLQPAQLYKELGYSARSDVNETPWELFLKLKATFGDTNES